MLGRSALTVYLSGVVMTMPDKIWAREEIPEEAWVTWEENPGKSKRHPRHPYHRQRTWESEEAFWEEFGSRGDARGDQFPG